MSAKNSSVAESLQEIAKLLLYLSEHYFSEANPREILLSKILFLKDMGLLCQPLSVLDVAALHSDSAAAAATQTDTGDRPHTNKLSYQQFYGWLLVLSGQLYPAEQNAKKALHTLITERILPAASRHISSDTEGDEMSLLTAKAVTTLAVFSEFLSKWFRTVTKQSTSTDLDSSASISALVEALSQAGCVDHTDGTQRSDFHTIVKYLVYGGDGRLVGSVDQFWSSLRSYHVSYNEFVLVAAGFFASGEGKDFDSGIVKFMERLSEHCMDEVLNHIVTIDEDLRSFLRPTSQETLGSPRSAGVVELWDVECVHVHSLWCYARQAGLLCSREAIQFMFDCSTGKTIACERLESVVPGVTREKNWVQSVISNLSLLVVHAADLDDIIFNAVNFLLSDHGGAGTSVTIRQKDFLHSVPADEAPIRVAVLLPDALLVQPMQLPASIRYAYFPFCIYKFLEEYECLESIHGRCKGINSDGGRLDHNSLRVSLRAVLEVLEEKLVTPDWISPEDCLRICNSVCDSICLRGCSADANRALDRTLSVLDMYEVLFAVAQSCKVGTQALNSSLGERDSIIHTIFKTDQQLRELQTSANLSINAWGSLEVLLSKLAEVEPTVGDVRKIGAHSAVKSVYNCGHDVAEIFDDNIAAIICSSLYASSQPRWRGQWLVQTSVSEVPVSTFPLDSPMKCTMDIVLFAAIINYPLSTPGYNIWTLLEHFSRCDTPSRPDSEKSGGSPIHEVCARRMYEFLRFLSDNYRIRTSDLLCHLQLSLLANECFNEASNDSVMRSEGNRKEIALQALASLSSQATLVLRLSSKAVWRTVSCSETSFVWEFLVSCGTSYGQYRGCKANHISQLDVWKRIAVSGVPDVASLQCGGILMNRAAAITWATEVTALFRYEISALEVTKVANRFIDKLFHIRGFSDAGCGAVLSFGMFIVFGLHVLCSCDGDIKRATSKWCDYSNSRAKERYWESHVPASALLLSPKRLQMVLELDNVRELVRKSIKIFDAAQSKSIRFSDVGLNSLTCTAPPRPPGKLWDAPRCVQFCRQMGIQEYLSKEVYNLTDKSGINVVWNAVAIALKPHYSSAKLSPWASHSVVAPLPFQVSVDSIIDFLNILAKHLVTVQNNEQNSPSGIQEMVARLVMGSLCPLIVAHETVIGRTAGVEGVSDSRCAVDFSFPFSLEDMLRFGGGKVAATLNHYHSWLFEEYKFLSSAERVKFDAKNDLVTLSDACTYFSCKGLLKIKTAILVAGVSLSPRWRSAVGTVLAGDILSSDENRGEILKIAANNAAGRIHRARTAPPCETDVYITFQEFEELFLRCGYALYEQAGYLSALAPGQTTQSDFDHCKTPDLKSIVRHYVTECEKLRQLGKSKTTQFVSGSWGMDFLYPLASTLQLVSTQRDRSGLQIKPPNFVSKSEADPRGSISIEISKLISSSTGAAVTDPSSNEAVAQKGDLSHRVGGDESTASFSQLSVSFNSSAGPVVLPAPKNVVGIVDDAIIRGRDKYLETILAARQQQPTDGDVKDVRSAVQLKLSVPTRTSSGRRSPGAGSPNTRGSPRGSPRPTRSPKRSSPQSPAATERSIGIDALLDGTKEVLWPVFATYCSCGDSMEPGKLSGPNLFALLSKLNVLTDETALSDIGVLLHQVSSHTTAQAPSVAIFVDGDDENGLDSPLLSFEEFLVFLCAFSHLRYEGTSVLPDFSGKYARGGESTAQAVRPFSPEGDIANLSTDSVSSMIDLQGPTGETWLECWYHVMVTSPSFRRLLEECILPLLQKHALLAFPEDARHRDEYILIFSIEVLMTIQSNEYNLQKTFERHRRIDRNKASADPSYSRKPDHFIIAALEKIKIVPQKVSRTEVLQFVDDILPKAGKTIERVLTYPQWEWVLCIVAVKAVTNALGRNSSTRDAKMKNIIPFVSEVLAALAAAIVQNDMDT